MGAWVVRPLSPRGRCCQWGNVNPGLAPVLSEVLQNLLLDASNTLNHGKRSSLQWPLYCKKFLGSTFSTPRGRVSVQAGLPMPSGLHEHP